MSGNSLIFKTLTFKNFLSFGNTPVDVDLEGHLITVVLGENMDTGGEDSRNGVGKSSIIDALCYAMFGKVIRGISNPKLVNKLARKGQSMLVTLEFSKGDYEYLIERGEKPSKLHLFRKPLGSDEDFKVKDGRVYKYDISRNKTETNEDIERMLGFDIKLFEYLVVNSSESDSFMKLPEDRKRDVIEKLFGFDILSERAVELKDERRESKKKLIAEESAIEATKQANARVAEQVQELEAKSSSWEQKKKSTITELREAIDQLEQVDVEDEIETIKLITELAESLSEAKNTKVKVESNLREISRDIRDVEGEADNLIQSKETLEAELKSVQESICPTCKQHWEPDPEYTEGIKTQLAENEKASDEAAKSLEAFADLKSDCEAQLQKAVAELEELEAVQQELDQVELTYDSLEDAASADATLKALKEQLSKEEDSENPHVSSIESLREKAMKKINDSELKELQVLVEHYDLLINLLTNKDSFIRKLIIDRWLPKLNQRVSYYLGILELPHRVRFLPDLTMEITNFGQEFDWGNLSRGQRQRVTIAMNFAFQDVFEVMNYRINTLMVDELIDSGICNRGAENTVTAMKQMTERKGKRIFLITHRDDIAARIDDVLTVRMRNNQSTIEAGR